MAFQDILVHVPLLGPRTHVEAAIALAKRFNARLTGVCSLPETAILRNMLESTLLRFSDAETDTVVKRELDEAAIASRRFAEAAAQAGVAHAWLLGEGEAADVLLHACRLQDLAVVEQCASASDLPHWRPGITDKPSEREPPCSTSPSLHRR